MATVTVVSRGARVGRVMLWREWGCECEWWVGRSRQKVAVEGMLWGPPSSVMTVDDLQWGMPEAVTAGAPVMKMALRECSCPPKGTPAADSVGTGMPVTVSFTEGRIAVGFSEAARVC